MRSLSKPRFYRLTLLSCLMMVAGCPEGQRVQTSDAGDSNEIITDGVGTADDTAACTPGAVSCATPTARQECNSDGSDLIVTPCAEGLTCWPDSGRCKLPNCEPGERECRSADTYRVCDPHGISWSDNSPCPEGTFCSGDGECIGCQVGAFECVTGFTYRSCPDGSQWTEERSCGAGSACVDDQCCAFESTCNLNGELVSLCVGDDGAILQNDVTPCVGDTQCFAGACVSCIPGSTRCVAEGIQTCNADGMTYSEPTACPQTSTCIAGVCTEDGCLPRVILVVDRSGSMDLEWGAVTASINTLTVQNPGYYGLIAFPGVLDSCGAPSALDVPLKLDNSFALNLWMNTANVTGATPLLEVMETLSWLAPTVFEGQPGTLVVLSDGDDSCADGDVPQALGGLAQQLYSQYAITTYAIGYGYTTPDSSELNSLTSNGGSGTTQHLIAGNEAELTDAFQGIVDDIKYCN